MIQRKQTIFLLLAFVLLVVSAFGITATFKHPEAGICIATLSNFSLSDAHSSNHLYSIMGVMLLGAAGLSAAAIMMFRKRKLQMRMCWWIVFVLLVYYITRMSCVISIAKYLKLNPGFEVYEALPLFAIILVVFAYKGIRHDDKLVRDSYRIR